MSGVLEDIIAAHRGVRAAYARHGLPSPEVIRVSADAGRAIEAAILNEAGEALATSKLGGLATVTEAEGGEAVMQILVSGISLQWPAQKKQLRNGSFKFV